MPEVLLKATYGDLFKHFVYELLSDLAWANTKAGQDYFHYSQKILVNYILQEEPSRFACLLYNIIHPDMPMRVISPYK